MARRKVTLTVDDDAKSRGGRKRKNNNVIIAIIILLLVGLFLVSRTRQVARPQSQPIYTHR